MTPRLTSAMRATALIRLAESQGGFGAIVSKGDETAGALLVILLEKGGNARLFERALQGDSAYSWRQISQVTESEGEFSELLKRKRQIDPDLWIIELDVASGERFADEMNAAG